MTRTILSILAIGAILTAIAGPPAASQTVKWDFTYQHNQSDLDARKQQPRPLTGTGKSAKKARGLQSRPKTSKSLGLGFKKIEFQGIRTRDGK